MVDDACSSGANMEVRQNAHESKEKGQLQDQRGFHESESSLSLSSRKALVRRSSGAVACECLDDDIQADECRPDTTGMDGTEIGYVVKCATKDEIIGTTVYRRRGEEKDSRGDEDCEIVLVASNVVFTQHEAGDEQGSGPREEESDAPRAVFDVVLIDMENAGNEKEDSKGNGDALQWSVDVVRVWSRLICWRGLTHGGTR